MIVDRVWERYTGKKHVGDRRYWRYHDTYRGWFLFGIMPLYIKSTRERYD